MRQRIWIKALRPASPRHLIASSCGSLFSGEQSSRRFHPAVTSVGRSEFLERRLDAGPRDEYPAREAAARQASPATSTNTLFTVMRAQRSAHRSVRREYESPVARARKIFASMSLRMR